MYCALLQDVNTLWATVESSTGPQVTGMRMEQAEQGQRHKTTFLRKEAGRREAERRDLEEAEVARVEADTRRMEADSTEAEMAEAEREEAERMDIERMDIERREVERREVASSEVERREAERREAERREAERREAERNEAERREVERKEAERREAERREVEWVQATKKANGLETLGKEAAVRRDSEGADALARLDANDGVQPAEARRWSMDTDTDGSHLSSSRANARQPRSSVLERFAVYENVVTCCPGEDEAKRCMPCCVVSHCGTLQCCTAFRALCRLPFMPSMSAEMLSATSVRDIGFAGAEIRSGATSHTIP